jgi:hypothetical protein
MVTTSCAQHRPMVAGRDGDLWHIAPHGRAERLCRTVLDPAADTRPLRDLPRLSLGTWCQTCLAAFRHLTTPPIPWDAASGRPGHGTSQAHDLAAEVSARTRRGSRPRAGE